VHVADRRGLTAVGAVTVALVLGAAGGLIDVMTGPGLRTVFAVSFIAGCAFAALRVHREDLVAAVIMPPLVYVVLALLAGAFSKTAGVGGWMTRQALELATSLVLGAPVLLTATAVAFVIAVVRGVSGRRRRRPEGA
jgi:large-conductance mechanosensitive channel